MLQPRGVAHPSIGKSIEDSISRGASRELARRRGQNNSDLPQEDMAFRVLLIAMLAVIASGFGVSPLNAQDRMGRRQALTASAAAIAGFGLAGAAQAADVRKANQEAIGVSRVEKLSQGVGAAGVQKPVKLSYGYEGKSSVLGPNGAIGNAGPNGFWAGGEAPTKK